VLSIFDQTRKSKLSQQILNIDDSLYPEDDIEMQRILRRLLMAATDAEMRMDMNVEDEYFSIIEQRDTDILQKDRRIAEQNVEIAAKNEQLSQKDEQLRKSILLLAKAGLSPEAIAENLNININTVLIITEKC